MTQKTVAIIGMDESGKKHLEDWNNVGAKVVGFTALSATERNHLEEIMSTHRNWSIKGYGSHTEIIGRLRPDIVDICTPLDTHYDIACYAIESGADIAVERGFTQTLEEATAVAALASTHKKNILIVTPYSVFMNVFEHELKNAKEAEISFNRGAKRQALENLLPDVVSLIPPSYELTIDAYKETENSNGKAKTYTGYLHKGKNHVSLKIFVAINSLGRKEIFFSTDNKRYDLSQRNSRGTKLYFVVRNPAGEVREVPFPRRTLFKFLLAEGTYTSPFIHEDGIRSMQYMKELLRL